MRVTFNGKGFSLQQQAELDEVLQRIETGDAPGCWRERPDTIHVRGLLTDGRSGCEVLEMVVQRASREAQMVAKVGPMHELEGEWTAFTTYLERAGAFFAPIHVATPAVLGTADADGEREAVIYDHAARWAGQPWASVETLEAFARRAIREGGPTLDRAEKVLETLFQGIRNDLYDRHEVDERETSAREAWNLRLGVAAVLEVDELDSAKRLLTLDNLRAKPKRLRPLDLLAAAAKHDADIEDGASVEVRDLRAEWWGDRLMGRLAAHLLRLEVVTPDGDGRPMRRLASALAEGDTFHVRGRLRSLRARLHHQRLEKALPELAETSIADPFTALPQILEAPRGGRLAALVHGDLNPRNVLLVGAQPVLIDYAFTRSGEPFFLDFTRLEGCLVREVLPLDFSLAQLLRLERLLAVACRLGGRGADRFAQSLAGERPELGAAFRLFWILRRSARDTLPEACVGDWLRDYMEQLFFFAHLSLKWLQQTPAALRATTAMAGAAAEALSGIDLYRHWTSEELRGDGLEILRLAEPRGALSDLAAMARVLRRRRKKEDRPLHAAYEALRSDFVRARFADEANKILVDLEKDHDVYISLQAYIDLRGRLHAGRKRRRMSFEEMVESDAALAESEHLKEANDDERQKDDVLSLLAAEPALVLIGDAGAGKSTVAREWQYRLAQAIVGRAEAAAPRLPLVVRAPDLRARIGEVEEDDRESIAAALGRETNLLDAGAIHLTVDALNELPEADKQRVAEWILTLRKLFPATPIVACHRQYNYTPGLLPFPVVSLEKVEAAQARNYILEYLRSNEVDEWRNLGERLAALLLDDPEHQQVRDLAQTPLFLWMLVERYRQTGIAPEGRGGLFEDFSRWYLEERHHQKYGEAVTKSYAFENKATLLGRLGYALVERGIADLEESEAAAWDPEPGMLEEIVASELLLWADGKLRFLHQSFQEYFAARHFLAYEASDPKAIQRKVRTLGWHDTLAVLLGFSGEATEVVTGVIEAAADVNPGLTARCLRLSEAPVEALLERFASAQEKILREPNAGMYAHQRAARALAEHGRGTARVVLLRIAADESAPVPARAEILRVLAPLPAQPRFEPVRETIRNELKDLLAEIFESEAPEEVRRAAIGAAIRAELHELSLYLRDLVAAEAPWGLRQAAWDALGTLGVPRTARLRAKFVQACQERLERAETELYEETVVDRMDALNDERVEILEQIASAESLPLLLERRFRYRIHEPVRKIVDRVIELSREPPEEIRSAWEILREEGDADAVERWWHQLRRGSGLDRLAAAHRLAALGPALDTEPLRALLVADLDADQLAIVAELCGATADAGLAEPMGKLSWSLVENVEGPATIDAFTRLVSVLLRLDDALGRRLVALATMVLHTKRREEARSGSYPWRKRLNRVRLKAEDFNMLLLRGGDEAKAAIIALSALAAGALLDAQPVVSQIKVSEDSLERFREIAEGEDESAWQNRITAAVARLQKTEFLPQILRWGDRPELASLGGPGYYNYFGTVHERYLANFLRAIGYLARLLRDNDQPNEAEEAVAFLHDYAATLAEAEHRSLVVGCTTGLGYLGEWQPILNHLGPAEPWMHSAAKNVFAHWVDRDLRERERAARWIARRLHQRPDLAPEVRSTLGELLERLEGEIGRHVGADEEDA